MSVAKRQIANTLDEQMRGTGVLAELPGADDVRGDESGRCDAGPGGVSGDHVPSRCGRRLPATTRPPHRMAVKVIACREEVRRAVEARRSWHDFADRLAAAVRRCGNPVMVGLDPRCESLPRRLRSGLDVRDWGGVAQAYVSFCRDVIDVVAPLVAVVKPQAAFFEQLGPAGHGRAGGGD